MRKSVVILLKVFAHLLCLAPILWLVRFCISERFLLNSDPVKMLIHFTGDWAIYLLLGALLIKPICGLSARLSRLIRFRRLLSLYAFFYATLHLLIYFFLFSGYNVISAFAGFHTGHPEALIIQWKIVWPALSGDLRTHPSIPVGIFAWGSLLALMVAAPVFVPLSRENIWKLFRGVFYIAALSAFVHAWWSLKGHPLNPQGIWMQIVK